MTSDNEYDVHANVSQNYSYKLLELTPELLQVVEVNEEPLQIKAPTADSEIVICTKDQTFGVRQRNHSNTVMIMSQGKNRDKGYFCGYTKMSSVFEAKKSQGHIETADVPLYEGQESVAHIKNGMTTEFLKNMSTISDMEFGPAWFKLNGSSYNGLAIILSDEFITRTLHVMIMSIMAASLNFSDLSLIEVFKSMEEDQDFSIDIVETVLQRFSTSDKEPFSLDKTKVGQWYGIEALRKYCRSKPMELSDFLIKWKSELPPFFECPIDTPLLKGHYVTPLPERIQYVSKLELPSDIQNRLKHLFKLQSIWELHYLEPFIDEFNLKGVKNENFIMKYAKKKKVGKKIIITQR